MPLAQDGCAGAVTQLEIAFDLTSETFAAALISLRRYEPGRGPAAGWLLGIAHDKLLESRRRGRVEAAARRSCATIRSRAPSRSSGCSPSCPASNANAIRARVLDERDYAEIAAERRRRRAENRAGDRRHGRRGHPSTSRSGSRGAGRGLRGPAAPAVRRRSLPRRPRAAHLPHALDAAGGARRRVIRPARPTRRPHGRACERRTAAHEPSRPHRRHPRRALCPHQPRRRPGRDVRVVPTTPWPAACARRSRPADSRPTARSS